MSEHPPTYEYAEVFVGWFGRGEGVKLLTFLHVRDMHGEHFTPDFMEGPLEALNLMGAQGWQIVEKVEPHEGRIEWIASSARRHDSRAMVQNREVTEYLMTRQVRD